MSSSKFRRRPRPQQPPAICKKPPIPEPPDTPILTLQALASWHGYDFDGNPVNLDRTIRLEVASLPIGNHYAGFSYPYPANFNLTLWRNSNLDHYLCTLQLYEGGVLADAVAIEVPPNPRFPPAVGTVAFAPGPRPNTCITAIILL